MLRVILSLSCVLATVQTHVSVRSSLGTEPADTLTYGEQHWEDQCIGCNSLSLSLSQEIECTLAASNLQVLPRNEPIFMTVSKYFSTQMWQMNVHSMPLIN